MEELLSIDKTFEKAIYCDKKIINREFDGCIFRNCDFSSTVFSECVFIDCEFLDCNIAMAKFPATSLKTVAFTRCKILGVQFNECEDFLFNVNFTDCILDYSWFTNKKMPKTNLISCSLRGVNFSSADLTSAVFGKCNLEGAIFDETALAAADFTTAYNFKIDPELNSMKKAKFSVDGIPGLLDKYDINIE